MEQVIKSVSQINRMKNLQSIKCHVPSYLTVIQLNLPCTLLVIWVLDLFCVSVLEPIPSKSARFPFTNPYKLTTS